MKNHPILFATPMVQAILAGRKTQTRRIIKPAPTLADNNVWQFKGKTNAAGGAKAAPSTCSIRKGDRLYVRETFFAMGGWRKNGLTPSGKQKWRFSDETMIHGFEYKYMDTMQHAPCVRHEVGWHKRSSLFMPKAAVRIWLEVTDVKAEMLQDISEHDSIAEGVERLDGYYLNYRGNNYVQTNARGSFISLWKSINGTGSWVDNLWLWVYTFRVLSVTGAPI